MAYLPRTRPLPRTIEPFPILPTREDWPNAREVIGGWSLTPFGGRGRFDGRIVEVEGIVSITAMQLVGVLILSEDRFNASLEFLRRRYLAQHHKFRTH